MSLLVNPVSSSGSAGAGDAENHVGGAGVSPRRPERRQKGRAAQIAAGAGADGARTVDR